MASFRYRAQIPGRELGWLVNDLNARTVILAKPSPFEASLFGRTVIVDYCDDHFDRFPHYREFLKRADAVTCPTEAMRERILSLGRSAVVVPDPYEYPELSPHCRGGNLLWFGHQTNLYSLQRVLPELAGQSIRVVTNAPGAIPWSFGGMFQEFLYADIVILPATKGYKSPNRAVEAIRQGCFVVAEPHPSLDEFPVWKGNIQEGVEWTRANLDKANEMTREAQRFVSERYAPRTAALAWRSAVESVSTSGLEESVGRGGSLSESART